MKHDTASQKSSRDVQRRRNVICKTAVVSIPFTLFSRGLRNETVLHNAERNRTLA